MNGSLKTVCKGFAKVNKIINLKFMWISILIEVEVMFLSLNYIIEYFIIKSFIL